MTHNGSTNPAARPEHRRQGPSRTLTLRANRRRKRALTGGAPCRPLSPSNCTVTVRVGDVQITNRSRTRAWKRTMGVKAFGVLLAILAAASLVITDQTFWSLQMQGIIPARWWILISAAVGSLPYETFMSKGTYCRQTTGGSAGGRRCAAVFVCRQTKTRLCKSSRHINRLCFCSLEGRHRRAASPPKKHGCAAPSIFSFASLL